MSKITSDYPSNMCQSMFDNSVSLKAVTTLQLDYYVPGILSQEQCHLLRGFPLLGSLDVEIKLFSFFGSQGEYKEPYKQHRSKLSNSLWHMLLGVISSTF